MGEPKISVQMYTLRNLTANDMLGTLKNLADIGYEYVEFAGYGSSNAEEIAAALRSTGLKTSSAHVGIERLENELDTVFSEMTAIGCPHIVVPWLKPERREQSLLPAFCDELNELAVQVNDAGFDFGYHNHDFEFAPYADSGETVFDYMRKNCDPAVNFQLDLYWAAYANVEPVDLIQQFAGRVPLLHCKDMAPGSDKHDAIPGTGVLDWTAVIPAAIEAGTEFFIHEQDNPTDALISARVGLENLQKLLV